ncbi:MAG TPA: protein kinase [Polyangiaceae bacterium]|jgi:serine/threonine-protein kinase|nr:protein kinase [Polyangiaceae bacterium]
MIARQQEATEHTADEAAGGHKPQDLIAGKYLLRYVIGVGGMGTVWAAMNLDLDLEVALKVVNKGMCSDETRARLATEARAEAKVQHRGIVRVLDLGVTDQGEPFLVMERLEGRSLGELLDQDGHLESRDAVRTMLPVLEALAYAHDRGVVHRDLKPDNIFLSEQCGKIQPKLVDFGIAKLGGVPVNRRHTGRGAVVGSPGYMAPEHARGVDVDHRADIFCASLVLYEAISGRSAFRGDNYNALLRAVIEQELEPITAFGRGDAELSRILTKGLHKNPTRRHATCLELGRELATWLMAQGDTEDVTGEPLTSWWQRTSSSGVRRTTNPNEALPAVSETPRPGRRATASLRGVSISTAGAPPPRRTGRRLAFLALAITAFAGGIAATTAFDLFPGQASRTTARAATASLTTRQAPMDPGAPIVTPVEPAAATPAPRSVAENVPATPAPRANAAPWRAHTTTSFPVPKAPPTFVSLEQSRAFAGNGNIAPTHVDLDRGAAPVEPTPLKLPDDPPPPHPGLRASSDPDLKDPYP